jgi:hypothetical protein
MAEATSRREDLPRRAKAVLVLGVLSSLAAPMLGLNFVLGGTTLFLARGATKEVLASSGRVAGLRSIRIGVTCAWIGMTLLPLVFVAWVIVFFVYMTAFALLHGGNAPG